MFERIAIYISPLQRVKIVSTWTGKHRKHHLGNSTRNKSGNFRLEKISEKDETMVNMKRGNVAQGMPTYAMPFTQFHALKFTHFTHCMTERDNAVLYE